MAERDPIDLIKEQLGRIEGLAGLHAGHEAFLHWHGETKTILEKVFSPKSIHCQNFLALRFQEMGGKLFASPEIDKLNSARYKRDLDTARNILQAAIKELTLDRTLFKKIQTTPKTVEISLEGEYFISADISDPEWVKGIKDAFEGSGLSPIGGSEGEKKEVPFNQRLDQLRRARFGIYDLSVPNRPDVLLELGAALALGREIIIIYKKGSTIPAGLRHLERIEFENRSDLADKLKRKIRP